MTGGWLEEIGRQLRSVGDVVWDEVRAGGLLPLLEPAPPFNRSGLLAPAVAIGGLIGVILLSGIAVTALGSLLLALFVLYLLLAQVFGLSIELHPFPARCPRASRLLAQRLPAHLPELRHRWSQLGVTAEAGEARTVRQALSHQVQMLLDRLAGRGVADVDPVRHAAL